MTKATRAAAFALACFTLLGGYVAARRSERAQDAVPEARSPGQQEPLAPILAHSSNVQNVPRLFYRSARSGEFGRIVVAALDDTEGLRVVTPLHCERAHFDERGGLCLTYNRDAPEPNFRALLVDSEFRQYRTTPIAGYPSRTTLSRDGKYAALTVFATGDSYDGDFSTRTLIMDRQSGQALPDLEQFNVSKDEMPFKRVDFNFWGVTFTADSQTFYATLGTKGATYLVKGDVATKTLSVVRENVECPSLSPNGKRIAFKRRHTKTGASQLYTLDTKTWQEAAVPGEERHIDDQAAWLDDDHLLYGVTTSGAPEQALNVWLASIAEEGDSPRVFVAGASSPSVVRNTLQTMP